MHFSTFYNPDQVQGENLNEVSLTIPGQDMTVQEVLRRYVSGTLPPVNHKFVYDGKGDDFESDPVASARDLVDLENISNHAKMRLAEAKQSQRQEPQTEEVGKPTPTSEEA